MPTFCCIFLNPMGNGRVLGPDVAWKCSIPLEEAADLLLFCFMGHCKLDFQKILGLAQRIKSSCISSENSNGVVQVGNASADFQNLLCFASLRRETLRAPSWVMELLALGQMWWVVGTEGSWMGETMVQFGRSGGR